MSTITISRNTPPDIVTLLELIKRQGEWIATLESRIGQLENSVDFLAKSNTRFQ